MVVRTVLWGWAAIVGLLLLWGLTLRLVTPQWPPEGVVTPTRTLLWMTAAYGISAVLVSIGRGRLARRRPLELAAALVAALVFGGAFFALEGLLGWQWMRSGLSFGEPAGRQVLLLLGAHLLQVALGLGGLCAVLVRALDGRSGGFARASSARLWVAHWWVLGITWLGVVGTLLT